MAASLNLRISKISINIKILQSQGLQGSLRMERLFMIAAGKEKSMGNHKNRTEVKEAFKHGHRGRYSYVNDITKTDLLLCAEVKRWNDSSDEPGDSDDRKTDGRYHSDHRLDSCSCNDIICDIIKNVDRSYRRTDQPDKFDTSKTEQNI